MKNVWWSCGAIFYLLFYPLKAFARRDPDDDRPEVTTDYLEDMKKFYGFKTDDLDDIDWIFTIGMTLATITCVGSFVYLIINIVMRIINAQRGKVTLFDSKYWIRVGVSFMLIFFLVGGIFMVIIERFYGSVFSVF
ncbi:hypothetical protein [Brevibacillus sp. SYSU BS000544]|uniref:hypothetical protein n=1 Tax=Brevibacillus sp. SYSU BS000544 TaxID=3416443 RepID=UPI003CE46B16